MTYSRPSLRSTTNVEVLLNTLEAERHARGALLVAFVDELRAAMMDRAPESTRVLLARAERGEMGEPEFRELLDELRAFVRTAA
jgi:hypothetical protein